VIVHHHVDIERGMLREEVAQARNDVQPREADRRLCLVAAVIRFATPADRKRCFAAAAACMQNGRDRRPGAVIQSCASLLPFEPGWAHDCRDLLTKSV